MRFQSYLFNKGIFLRAQLQNLYRLQTLHQEVRSTSLIFLFRLPHILQSDNGKEFKNVNLTTIIREKWPECRTNPVLQKENFLEGFVKFVGSTFIKNSILSFEDCLALRKLPPSHKLQTSLPQTPNSPPPHSESARDISIYLFVLTPSEIMT